MLEAKIEEKQGNQNQKWNKIRYEATDIKELSLIGFRMKFEKLEGLL